MDTIWEGHLAGVFEGYAAGRVHELSEGGRWRQEDRNAEYVYREEPKARLLRDSTGRSFLDVEGTSGVVHVVPYRGMRGMGPRMFQGLPSGP